MNEKYKKIIFCERKEKNKKFLFNLSDNRLMDHVSTDQIMLNCLEKYNVYLLIFTKA